MQLNFITGAAGTGKSVYAVDMLCRETEKNPGKHYFLFVPEQNTLRAQKDIIRTSGNHGMLDLDVLSFRLLAYRVLSELGMESPAVLDELSRAILIRKAAGEVKKELKIYSKKTASDGFVRQMDSIITEFCQYDVDAEKLSNMANETKDRILAAKLSDIALIYERFLSLMYESSAVPEEIPVILSKLIHRSHILDDAVIVFDGFTGFTPVQKRIIEHILTLSDKCYFTVTIPENISHRTKKTDVYTDIFDLSRETMADLLDIAAKNHVPFGQDITLSKPYHTPEILVKEASDMTSEVRAVISDIRKNVLSRDFIPYSKMAIAVTDMESYRTILERELDKNDIPYFMDKKADAFGCAYASFIRGTVKLISDGYKRDDVIAFLRNPLFMDSSEAREQIDILDNVMLARGINGRKKLTSFFEIACENSERTEDGAAKQNGQTSGSECVQSVVIEYRQSAEAEPEHETNIFAKAKEHLDAVFSLHDRLTEEKQISGKIKALNAYLETASAAQKNETFIERLSDSGFINFAEDNKRVMEMTDDLLLRLDTVIGEEKASLKEFSGLLDAGFAQLKAGVIPETMDMLVIGDIKRSRFDGIDVLYVIGASDGLLPSTASGGGLFTDRERIKMQAEGIFMAPDDKTSSCIERFYFYLLKNKPSKKFIISYPAEAGDNKQNKPSEMINELIKEYGITVTKADAGIMITGEESALELLSKMLSEQNENDREKLRDLVYFLINRPDTKERAFSIIDAAYKEYSPEKLNYKTANGLYGDIYRGSVTSLESYNRCPYSHFLRYGISLSEREEYDVSAVDIGNLYHRSLDDVFNELAKRQKTVSGITEKELYDMAERSVKRVTEEYNNSIMLSSARNAFIRKKVLSVTKKTLRSIMELQKNDGFVTTGTEVPFNVNEEKLALFGKIDRIDCLDSDDKKKVRVIDYKSGSKQFEIDLVKGGIQLQLGTYLDRAVQMTSGSVPYGMYYFGIKEALIDYKAGMTDEDIEKGLLKAMKPQGISTDDISEDELSELLSGIKENEKVSANRILTGDIEVRPYIYKNQETGCRYCPYSSVCSFENRISGYSYRDIPVSKKGSRK